MNVRFYQVECKNFQDVFYCSVYILYIHIIEFYIVQTQMAGVSNGSIRWQCIKRKKINMVDLLKNLAFNLKNLTFNLKKSYN